MNETSVKFGVQRPIGEKRTTQTLIRLAWLIERLRTNPRVAMRDVMERWPIAVRSFRRDLARLRCAGYEIDVRDGVLVLRGYRDPGSAT